MPNKAPRLVTMVVHVEALDSDIVAEASARIVRVVTQAGYRFAGPAPYVYKTHWDSGCASPSVPMTTRVHGRWLRLYDMDPQRLLVFSELQLPESARVHIEVQLPARNAGRGSNRRTPRPVGTPGIPIA